MNRVFIVTGTTRGLGKELTSLILKDKKNKVISLSRHKIDEFKYQRNLIHFDIDFAKNDVDTLFPEILDEINFEHVIFINNAATINPIDSIGSLTTEEIQNHVFVNIISPIVLLNKLTPHLKSKHVKIINITSGVINNPIAGWSLYNSSKSAMLNFFKTLSIENLDWVIKNYDPGVMDTEMQVEIRSANFSERAKFKRFKKDKLLLNPKDSAIKILNDIL